MKLTYNWLKDFVDIELTPEALAHKLTMAGLEVISLEHKDRDVIFEIEVTANRPDLLSVFGIAREVAAITGKKLKSATGHKPQATGNRLRHEACSLRLEIENKKDCPLYTAKIIKDVKVSPSPGWLKKRLELIDCRSINNIVDITNYCLFTWGEPLHAFDLDKLNQNTIFVRRAKMHEKITTIDGVLRTLNPDILVITNNKTAVAIAGIMGGKDTEVTDGTKNILLEAAVFNPIIIRHGRQILGTQTDSSYRFERGIDLPTAEFASWQAVHLIQDLAKASCVAAKREVASRSKIKSINLNVSSVHKILNINIAPAKIKNILNSLGFTAKTKSKNNLSVTVPSHRPDVNLEIDLLEEIARIFGYERIPKSLPKVSPQTSIKEQRDLVCLTKNILVGLGLNEVITYSLVDKNLLNNLGGMQEQSTIEILNPLSKEQEILRPSILPSLMACVAHNLNQKQGYINIFEVAKVFSKTEAGPKEQLVLGVALCGTKSLWFGQGHIQDEVGFLHLKGILEVLLQRLGIHQKEYKFNFKNEYEYSAYVKETKIGTLRKLERAILDKLDIKNKEVFAAEVALDNLLSYSQLNKKFVPLSRYPGISRDISLVLQEDISVERVMAVIAQMGEALLQEIEITDYYKGKQIDSGFKGLTISCLYASTNRTLTETEINPIHARIIQELKNKLNAKIR
jgi:phenylalanyl-tRNA synthetase beta chain